LAELDAVIAAIPDVVVDRDAAGPVLRVLILTAAMTGIRQSELLGLRWKDVDMTSQRLRVCNAWVQGEHSGEGKSNLSTRRSVPLTDRLARELAAWRLRTVFSDDDDLVFAHPELGVPLDRTKVSRRFQAACVRAEVRRIRFHDLRHTFWTTLAAAGVPMRTAAGIPRARGSEDDADLCPLRTVGAGGGDAQRRVRRRVCARRFGFPLPP
jgi:integrase